LHFSRYLLIYFRFFLTTKYNPFLQAPRYVSLRVSRASKLSADKHSKGKLKNELTLISLGEDLMVLPVKHSSWSGTRIKQILHYSVNNYINYIKYPNAFRFHNKYIKLYFNYPYVKQRPPLWSSGQSSWLQIRRPGFDSRH
jgi:hypothetical protein